MCFGVWPGEFVGVCRGVGVCEGGGCSGGCVWRGVRTGVEGRENRCGGGTSSCRVRCSGPLSLGGGFGRLLKDPWVKCHVFGSVF